MATHYDWGLTYIPQSQQMSCWAASAAMLTETGLPAILAPSREGERVYRRLGFGRVGELTIWSKASLAMLT